ncbi:hypothetical protein [Parabacteroides goldsteinii]|uniref:hypothetical protein n=1 Tax=Parabacteroides goldsteinii TaxID=328812 RepID=UPI001CCAC0FB|nr:hypothetical protein [Parabacteroides goldsteinii]
MNNFIVAAFISIAILWGLAACSDSDPTPPPVPETVVCLEGSIGASTRGVIGSGYEQDLKVNFARQDESAVSTGTYGGLCIRLCVRVEGGTAQSYLLSRSRTRRMAVISACTVIIRRRGSRQPMQEGAK